MNRESNEKKEIYDLVIVGGGITGLAILREAAVRGLRVCLVEKGDFGGATSAATSKLIHGGLRYLENFEFDLVRESLRERRLLAGSATRLVKPLPIWLPVYRYTRPGRFLLRMGLWIYDLLSFDRNKKTPVRNRMPMTRMVSKQELLRNGFPLKTEDLLGGFTFFDYQSLHPERLALAFLKTAERAGAVALNYTEVIDFELEDSGEDGKRISSVVVHDHIANQSRSIQAKAFVNATGPWMDLLIRKLKGKMVHRLNRSQGIHILTRDVSGGRNILNRNRSGRHFFLLSWMGKSLIGPTDTPYDDHPDSLHAKRADVLKLLEDVNEALPETARLHPEDVEQVIIGIRPLISTGEEESGTYTASRKAEMYDHAASGYPGLVSVAGGKWTTSRELGEDVIKTVLKMPAFRTYKIPTVDTRFQALVGSEQYGEDPEEVEKKMLEAHRESGLDEDILKSLFILYGNEMNQVLESTRENPNLLQRISDEPGSPGYDEILAQVDFAVRKEKAMFLSDILNRRLKAGTIGLPSQKALQRVAAYAGSLLNWTISRCDEEAQRYAAEYPRLPDL